MGGEPRLPHSGHGGRQQSVLVPSDPGLLGTRPRRSPEPRNGNSPINGCAGNVVHRGAGSRTPATGHTNLEDTTLAPRGAPCPEPPGPRPPGLDASPTPTPLLSEGRKAA